MKNNKFIIYLRWGLLALFTVLVTIAGYRHNVLGGGVAPSIHAICPFGAIQELFAKLGRRYLAESSLCRRKLISL